MQDILNELVALTGQGKRGALASLVDSSGSVPMSERAKILIREDGGFSGTIGGGCLEAEILSIGREVIKTGGSQNVEYTMTEKQAGENGLNCGGTVRIYTESIDGQKDGDLFASVVDAKLQRRKCVLITVISSDGTLGQDKNRVLHYSDGQRLGQFSFEGFEDRVSALADEVIESEKPTIVDVAGLDFAELKPHKEGSKPNAELFFDPFVPPPLLYVFGGGHVGAQIGSLAKNAGFHVVIVDDRPLFASCERHPTVDECVVAEVSDAFNRLQFDEQTYIVAATRGHQHDEEVVECAIRTNVKYIGMLGSERKKLIMWDLIQKRGGSRQRLDRVYAPIGFNIGADTPEEIAVSVVAELIEVRRGRTKEWKTKKMIK